MFVLITSECEVLGCDTKVEAFATKEEAYDAMVRDAKARAWDAGMSDDEFDMFIDSMGDDGGYAVDVVGWQIREIPGFFVPQEDAGWVKACLRDFGVGQTNFEASEMALEVCDRLKKYAEEA